MTNDSLQNIANKMCNLKTKTETSTPSQSQRNKNHLLFNVILKNDSCKS